MRWTQALPSTDIVPINTLIDREAFGLSACFSTLGPSVGPDELANGPAVG